MLPGRSPRERRYIRRIRTKFAVTGPVQLAKIARHANLLRMLSSDHSDRYTDRPDRTM